MRLQDLLLPVSLRMHTQILARILIEEEEENGLNGLKFRTSSRCWDGALRLASAQSVARDVGFALPAETDKAFCLCTAAVMRRAFRMR